jgi:hypothetical protein
VLLEARAGMSARLNREVGEPQAADVIHVLHSIGDQPFRRSGTSPGPGSTFTPSFLSLSVANYDEIGGCHNPKGVVADYQDFDQEPNDRNEN